MSSAIALLAAAILLFASWLVSHVALLYVVARSDVSALWKWLALVPVITPVSGWVARKRGAVVVWAVFGIAYGVVRLVGG